MISFGKIALMLHFFRMFNRQKVFEIDQLPIGLELSDGDRAALYGCPDMFVHEVSHVK